MKIGEINPINVWHGGSQVSANYLGIKSSNDNLVDRAFIQYWLLVDDLAVVSAELIMDGATYANWGHTGDANEEALEWVASQLNLTLKP